MLSGFSKTAVMVLMVGVGSVAFAADSEAPVTQTDQSPFNEGTGTRRLDPQEKADLIQYAENSKALLKDALERAEGKGFGEANRIYLSVIKKVVVASYDAKPRTELLLRHALNQAMELTFGVPSADGKFPAKGGVLTGTANNELMTLILEDSIQLAIRYYPEDRKAIDAGSLVGLPYVKFASERLATAQKWLASVTEWKYMRDFSQTALQQWLNTVLNVDNLARAAFAEEIVKVNNGLEEVSGRTGANGEELKKEARFLRGLIRRVLESLAPKLSLTLGESNLPTTTPDPPAPIETPRTSRDRDVRNASIGVGETVYNSNDGSPKGKVIAIFPNGDLSIQFETGKTDKTKLYTWPRNKIAKASGCYDNLCVGDGVINNDEPAKEGTIVGIFPDGEYAIRYQDAVSHKRPGSRLATPHGCANGLCVGDRVINRNGAKGTVAGIFSSNGKFAVKFDVDGTIYAWGRDGLAKM